MRAETGADIQRPPLIRFVLLVASGLAAFTLLVWSLASWGPKWLPDAESTIMLLGAAVAFAAVLRAGLTTPLQGLAAIAICVILHMAIYYAPLFFLLGGSINRYVIRDFTEIAGVTAVGYALAIAAALLFAAVNNRDRKARTE